MFVRVGSRSLLEGMITCDVYIWGHDLWAALLESDTFFKMVKWRADPGDTKARQNLQLKKKTLG